MRPVLSIGLCTVLLLTHLDAQVRRLDVATLLDLYAVGRYDEALAPVVRATRAHAREFRLRLTLQGNQWVDAVPADRSRRALVAAAFVLEAERIRAERGEWPVSEEAECAGRCVIEWACTLIQTRGTPDEAERVWMLASIAVAGGVRDWTFLQTPLGPPTERNPETGHVHHAIARLPDETRFRLARAVAIGSQRMVTTEMDGTRRRTRTPPSPSIFLLPANRPERLSAVMEQRQTTAVEYAKRELLALTADATVGVEARIRLGYLEWVTGNEEPVFASRSGASGATTDADLQYLASFLAGQAAHARGDLQAAEAHYAAALAERPHSQSATLSLAALLYIRGDAKQAQDLVIAARSARPRDDDPWRMFLYGDFPKLPALVAELRRLVRS